MQSRLLDHVLVGEGMLKAVMDGRMLGRRGRKRKRFLNAMKRGRTYSEMKKEVGWEGVGLSPWKSDVSHSLFRSVGCTIKSIIIFSIMNTPLFGSENRGSFFVLIY
jgi:hypothetical protein